MPKYADRAKSRIERGLQKFRGIIKEAERVGFNEADTGAIVGQMLSDVLGYERFFEVTQERKVRGRWADFAVKMDGETRFFVEVKAIGTPLRERDLFQIMGYSANENLDWMVLTNGRVWQCYHRLVGKPPVAEIVFDLDLLGEVEDPGSHVEQLFLISREGFWKGVLCDYWEKARALSPPVIARALFSLSVLTALRREIRKATHQRVEQAELTEALSRALVKPNVLEQMGQPPLPAAAGANEPRRRMRKAELPAECFAYVPDVTNPSTWELRYRNPDGTPDAHHLAAAVAAISPGGHRGRRVSIPAEALPAVKATLRNAYEALGKSAGQVPEGIR